MIPLHFIAFVSPLPTRILKLLELIYGDRWEIGAVSPTTYME